MSKNPKYNSESWKYIIQEYDNKQKINEELGNLNKYEIRKSVNKQVSLKYSPDLKFVLDRTFDQLDETRRLLGQDVVRRDVASED